MDLAQICHIISTPPANSISAAAGLPANDRHPRL
jgi:hypothetical protein